MTPDLDDEAPAHEAERHDWIVLRTDRRSALQRTGVLGRVNTPLAALAADAVLTRPPRARPQALAERQESCDR